MRSTAHSAGAIAKFSFCAYFSGANIFKKILWRGDKK
jgi:hypothetical protein